jgi:CHAT domain-containing protein
MNRTWRSYSQRRATGFACARDPLRFLVFQLLLISAVCHLGSVVLRPQPQDVTAPGPAGTVPGLSSIESRRQALAKLTTDRDRLRETNDTVALIRTITEIGELHLKLNDLEASLSDAREALTAARQTRDETLLIEALILAARVHRYRQNSQAALNLLNEAHALSLSSKNRLGEAQTLTELGAVYFQRSDLPNSRDSNDKALEIWQELQNKRGEARTLTDQGETYMLLDKGAEAANALEAAANIWRSLSDSIELATALMDISFLAIRQGQWQKALSTVNEAQLLVNDKEAEPYLAGQIATVLGEAFEAYGQLDTALGYFQQALPYYRDQAHDDPAAIDAGRQVGRVRARLGDYAGAAQQVEQGLKRAEEIGADFAAGLCHEELGKVWLAAGSYEQAHQEFLSAIALYQRTGNRRPWARAQTFLGQTEYLQGNLESASVSYGKALRFFKGKNVQDFTNEAALCFGLGKLALRKQKLEEAGTYLQRSISLTELLRENASSKELRSSFLASVHDRYETYVEWLMQRDAKEPGKQFAIAAFEASERGRARSLLDSLKDSQRELRQVANPALLLDEEKLQKEEQGLLDEQAKQRSEGSVREAREKLETELKQVRTRRETLEAQINSTAKFNNLMRALPLEFDEIRRQVTDADTSLLEYSLGDQTSYLWMITPSGMTSYKLPGKNTVERAVLKLSGLLAKPHTEPAEEAELQAAIGDVSVLLLGPVAERLSSTRLIIVPDGILQYIPFQILGSPITPNEPLIVRHEIVNAPSASTLAAVQREAINRQVAPKLLAAMGDPVLPSNYVAKAAELERVSPAQRGSDDTEGETLEPAKLGPLFFARHELNELRKLAPANDMVVYSDFAATRDNLLSLDLRQYRILHFATHGLLDAKQPELSGLVLSLVDRNGRRVNGFVGLSDIYNLRAPVDLVVLSACRTALGKEVRGEGLVGLTRGFMYAGASTVVASLWKVDDEATAELMKRFYGNLLQGGMTPAAALRAAQNSIRQEPQWHSPYYWAAFTLQGDYRQIIAATPNRTVPTHLAILAGVMLLVLVIVAAWWYRRNSKRRIV